MAKIVDISVLLVQHDQKIRKNLSSVLTRNGFAVTSVAKAMNALEILDGNEKFQILLIVDHLEDMPMQELVGLAKISSPSTEIITASSQFNAEEQQEMNSAGARAYVPNTDNRNILIEAMRNSIR